MDTRNHSERQTKRVCRTEAWVRFPGIKHDAKTLGVTRVHLYLVLTGQRVSKRLTSRYAELQAEIERTAR